MSPRRKRRRVLLILSIVVAALLAVLAASAAAVGLRVGGDARAGRRAFDEGRVALVGGDAAKARNAFERARASFASARRRLGSAVALPVRVVPVTSGQVSALRAIMDAGALSSRAGLVATNAVAAAPPGGWTLSRGAVDLQRAQVAGRFVRDATSLGELAMRRLEAAPDGWVYGPVASALHDTRARVADALDGLSKARDGLERLPSLLARGGTNRYLVALTNPAELRGTGGTISYVLVVEASDGRLSVVPDSGRPVSALPPLGDAALGAPDWFVLAHGRYGATRVWENVNTSIDLPAVGRMVARAASAELGPIDGVVLLTPDGLASLIGLSDPVRVEAWPEPISSDNVAQILSHDMFARYERDPGRRDAFMGELLQAALGGVLATDVPLSALSGPATAARGGHVQLFARRSQDQLSLHRLGLAGDVDRARLATDVLAVVTSNAVGNKIDWFLRREIVYRVSLDPEDGSARTELVASLVNRAPGVGEPPEVIEPLQPFVAAGTNRQIVLIVRPPTDELTSLRSGGRTEPVAQAAEADMTAYHTGALIGPGDRTQITSSSRLVDALDREDGELKYRLHVLRQPVANPDFYDVRIETPPGWSVEGATSFVGTLERDLELEVTLRRTLRARLVDTLVLGPWRAARDFVSGIF